MTDIHPDYPYIDHKAELEAIDGLWTQLTDNVPNAEQRRRVLEYLTKWNNQTAVEQVREHQEYLVNQHNAGSTVNSAWTPAVSPQDLKEYLT